MKKNLEETYYIILLAKNLPKEVEPDHKIKIEYTIADSLHIKSLNTLLYKVHQYGWADASEYTLIFDLDSKRIYPVIYQHWGMYNRPVRKELAIKVLESEEVKRDIEPINYSFLHLEIFLNQNETIYENGLNYDSIDSIFQFYLNNRFRRIISTQELDSIAQKREENNEGGLSGISYWSEVELLKKKIKEPGVFIYQEHYDAPFEYFEINSSADTHYYTDEVFFKRMYNLKSLLW